MIYIADGPSDIPAFSVVKGRGGATFANMIKANIRSCVPEPYASMYVKQFDDFKSLADYLEFVAKQMRR